MTIIRVGEGIVIEEINNYSSVKDYLLQAEDDSYYYTTMRMVGRNGSIPEFEMHLNRIKTKSMEERAKIAAALQKLHKEYPIDLRVTLMKKLKSERIEILAEEMPVAEIDKTCQVEIRKGHRENVTEKSSKWMK